VGKQDWQKGKKSTEILKRKRKPHVAIETASSSVTKKKSERKNRHESNTRTTTSTKGADQTL